MKTMQKRTSALLVLILLALSTVTWAQDDSTTDPKTDPQEEKKKPVIQNEISVGLYYQDEDADRFGKYSGLTDDDWYIG